MISDLSVIERLQLIERERLEEIMDELDLTATVGTQRGGIKCISGVCREFPAFAGGRIEVVGRL